jgi:hypothetical protein
MAANRVQAIKWEDPAHGGGETDLVPTTIDPHEDFVEARGVAIQNDTSTDDTVLISRDASSNMTLADPVAGSFTLAELAAGGMTSETHRVLPQLTHEIDASGYEEYAWASGRVTGCVRWASVAKLLKVREWTVTYTGGQVTSAVEIQYNAAGVEVERIDYTYAYTGGLIASVTATRTAA